MEWRAWIWCAALRDALQGALSPPPCQQHPHQIPPATATTQRPSMAVVEVLQHSCRSAFCLLPPPPNCTRPYADPSYVRE